MKVPPIVPYTAAVVGVWIVYTAIRNESPRDVLVSTLSGRPGDRNKIDPTAGATGGSSGDTDTTGGSSGLRSPGSSGPMIESADDPRLVKIGQGSHRLNVATAAAFAAWQRAFGQTIPITDSWRSPSQQQTGYDRDPNRFGSPQTSRHVRGEAVDVNLGAINAAPGQRNWNRLYTTAVATGWCNPRGPGRGDGKEPWHFSFNGCG